ncbi:MAG: DUF1153 domain-containing protein [Rhodobacteraceae bacterium]|nr:DUF1153 domain-containing protein [Paracoccaceae bacterium]
MVRAYENLTRVSLPFRLRQLNPGKVASRKAAVVRGVAFGLLDRDEALDRYGLSEEEFASWVRAITEHGEPALKTTRLQRYRQP